MSTLCPTAAFSHAASRKKAFGLLKSIFQLKPFLPFVSLYVVNHNNPVMQSGKFGDKSGNMTGTELTNTE